MKIAFCLFKYFPYGGLQRDFLRIARICAARGHDVHVYTMRWEGVKEPGIHVHKVKVSGKTNHARAKAFSRMIDELLSGPNRPLVVGFNKMNNLDIYYAADVCYQARVKESRGFFYRLMPRYRTYLALEKAVFASKRTQILLLSAEQQEIYSACYGTPADHFHLLPPGIERDRLAPLEAERKRAAKRHKLGLNDSDIMLLMVGSGYKTKGLDRAIQSLGELPDALRARCHLYVIGKGEAEPYQKLARAFKVEQNLHIMGPKKAITSYLLAADLLLHPSYHENTGTAILEALAAGLPVLTTAACGYAHYVTDANAGHVLPLPFHQADWNAALLKMLTQENLRELGANGNRFAAAADIYNLPEHAADFIEQWAAQRDLSR
jgi:UDP-glucose:(heptosyl)LPS alpha-1,3-glucosyltransferase